MFAGSRVATTMAASTTAPAIAIHFDLAEAVITSSSAHSRSQVGLNPSFPVLCQYPRIFLA
jgi:hypothetical protein